MRSGLYKRIPTGDDVQDRIQANIRDAVDTLAADHDVISAPINSLVVTAAIASGKAINWYRGTPGATLTLPLANALGANVAAVVIVANASSGAISVIAAQPNALTVGMSISVAAGAHVELVSDGISKWAIQSSGGVTDGDKGDVIVSGSGTAWTIDVAYSRARLEDAKAMASLHP